jgi:hypothetical protein
MTEPSRQQGSEVPRISKKEKAQAEEKKLLMEMSIDMIADKKSEVRAG